MILNIYFGKEVFIKKKSILINITMNTLNEYNNKYMIHEQFIKFFL